MNRVTVVEFLLARYNEEEAELSAPDFIEEPTSVRSPGWGGRGDCPICGAYQFDGTETVTETAWYEHAEDVHQRSHVLADLRAKRAIIELHHAIEQHPRNPEGVCAECSDSGWAGGVDSHTYVDMPCPTLRHLAAVYADHPDYHDGWRVG